MANVRYSAVYPIADAIKIFSIANEDLQCITQKIQNIFKGRTYSKRLLYIRIADVCFDRIDNKLFDQIFLNDLLNYSNDKIFNVRFSLSRFISKHLLNNNQYEKNDSVQKAIKILKNDDEDVEIKRFFMSTQEIEKWLRLKKEERYKNEILYRQTIENNNHNNDDNKKQITTTKESDSDSTDSSLYSSSDSSNDDDDDNNDQLKSVSDQLNSINDDLNNNKLKNMEIKEDIVDDFDSTSHGLVHQDTPYKLHISKELAAENEAEQKNKRESNTGIYGLEPDKNDEHNDKNVESDL